jgi:hypothetical protein
VQSPADLWMAYRLRWKRRRLPARSVKSRHALTPRMDRTAAIRDFYTPGNIVYSDYWRTHDRVLAYKADSATGWSVQVEKVAKKSKDGPWEAVEPPRWHSTPPDARVASAPYARSCAGTRAPTATCCRPRHCGDCSGAPWRAPANGGQRTPGDDRRRPPAMAPQPSHRSRPASRVSRVAPRDGAA